MSRALKLVVKVGTAVLTDDSGRLNPASLSRLVGGLAQLVKAGHQCTLVSSGAVGAGVGVLGLGSYPTEIEARQACAALGQAALMRAYAQGFEEFGLSSAQLLLTAGDLQDPRRRQNAKRTLAQLLSYPGVIPIINENDSVAIEELTFGDNDMLSVRVAELIEAEQLILLTSVDGLMQGGADGELIPEVGEVAQFRKHVSGGSGRFSIGGMHHKLLAVEAALAAGIPTLIANGARPEQLAELAAGGGRCTRFLVPKV